MTTETINQNKTLATVLHLSVFTKYFIPFGNFIFPMLLWIARKQEKFVDHHGRNALNFQISIFLYTIFLIAVAVALIIFFGLKLATDEPFFINSDSFPLDHISDALPIVITIGMVGILLLGLFVLELFAVISASIKASEGELYNYPLTINFLNSAEVEDTNHQ